jgi:hypothetical protein
VPSTSSPAGYAQDILTQKPPALPSEIAAAVTRITGIVAQRVLVVMESSPARFAVEGGRVLPEPGDEQAWMAGSGQSS